MTLEETSKLMAMIQAIYPRFQDGRDIRLTTSIWQRLFAEDDYAEVARAFSVFVATDTKGFPPAPGMLKELLVQRNGDQGLTDTQAWALVYKAVTRGLYNSREEFDKLPPLCQQVVGSPEMLREWATMDPDTVHSVIGSNFQRSFRARSESAREMAKLPASLRIALPELANIGRLPEGRVEVLPSPEPETDADTGRAAFLAALREAYRPEVSA